MSFVTGMGYMEIRGVCKKVSKYVKNQASGFVTYSLKKGGYFVFKKSFFRGYMGYKITLYNKINGLEHFIRLH